MKKNKIKFLLSVFLLVVMLLPSFLIPINSAKADTNKIIVITFDTAPTTAVASKAQLKFNKKFAFSYSFDDGLDDGYDPAFTYMNGGNSSIVGQYFGGLYFTDGAGNNVPFRGGYAFYSRNTAYSDIHINTPSYIKWSNLQVAVDSGWDVFNHGYTSASIPANDPNHVYYIGDPGGHATGTLDYSYELSQLNVDVGAHITLRNNSGATTTPLQTTHVILPNGDKNYTQPAFDHGYKGVYSQDSTFVFDGATTTAPIYTNVSNVISSDRLVMPRWFATEARYLAGGDYPGGLFNHVDNLASISSSTNRYWAQEFTHQITTSNYVPDWNGGITWTTWKSLMDHVENTYGRFGNDSAWVVGAEEAYDYMMVKQNTNLIQNLVGNQLTVEIDTTSVPANLRHYALSLLINANASISSISYGAGFTYHSDNKTTGLVNIDWGVNSYSKNDITRVESLVATAETSKKKSDIDVARSYNNLLVDSPNSTTSTAKAAFTSRLDAIVVPLRTWYVNVRGISTLVNCSDGNGATTTKTYAPSIYNWNLFTVGNTSAISCGDLTNIRDSDNQLSSISLSNTAPFKTGSLSSASTGNDSGVYPDAVLITQAQIYAATNTPAKIKISGLEEIKTYNIKLFGYTSATGATGNSTFTQYTIGSTTQELMVKGNTTSTVEFLNILPVSGEIEITIAPKVTAWGYGLLNAFEIKENLLAAPSSLSYNSPNTYTKNSAISPLSPTVTGQGITYSISPDLPSGLSISTSTGVISGTPSVASGQGTYTVTATNTGGSTSFGLVMTVNNIAPSSLSYNSPNVYTKNTAINPLSPTVTGEGITYSVSPSLPSGLSLDVDTGIISGTPTSTTSLATYTVTAANSGGSTNFGVVITVNPSQNVYNQTKDIWYETIQAAITAASSSDVINVNSGTFYERLVINKALTLNGAASTTTIIDGQLLGNPITVSASNVNITNFTVKNAFPDSASAGIWADSGFSSLYISDVIAKENTGAGFHLRADHSTLKNCIATDNIWGIRIDYTNNFTVDHCDSYNNQRTDPELPTIQGQGVRVVGVASGTFSNLNLYNNAWEGIYVGADGPSISNNITISSSSIYNNGVISPSVGVGVNIQTSINVTVKDSTISNNTDKGIYEVTSTSTVVENNTISGSKDNNIYSLQSNGGIIRNNTILGSLKNNIALSTANSFNVYGNTIYSALASGYYGIMMSGVGAGQSTHNTNIYNNTIRDNANGISLEKGAYANSIYNNQIYNHATSSLGGMGLKISGAGSGNTIKSNNIYNNYRGIQDISGGNTIYDNRFSNINRNDNYSTATSTVWRMSPRINQVNILGGSHQGGNYWSNYAGADSNGDGFGDTPHVINGAVIDNDPLKTAVTYYDLSYTAGVNGSITGSLTQIAISGANGTQVTAVPNANYHFVKWSDDVVTAARTETNVTANKSVTAQFSLTSSGDDNSDAHVINSSIPVYLPAAIGDGSRDAIIPTSGDGNIGTITNSGVNVLSYINSKADFVAPESSSNWQPSAHSLQISNLDLYDEIVTLTIFSKPQTIFLRKGESREIDIDGDRKNDIIITFVSTYVNRAEITIKSLAQVSANVSEKIAITKPISTQIKSNKFIFSKDLKLGVINNDVKELQKYLNANGYLISKSGAGSIGRETNIFGPATKIALIKFQKSKKINPAVGYFGLQTRKEINKIIK